MSDNMPFDIDRIEAVLEADRQRRIALVRTAVETALHEQRCELVAQPQIVDGRIVAAITIVAR